MKKKIIFISEMRNPHTNASSTQIMTRNLLYGFRSIFEYVVFVAILDDLSESPVIRKYYENLSDNIICISSFTKYRNDALKSKLSMVLECMKKHDGQVKEVNQAIEGNEIIVSHSPSIDSAILGSELKKRNPSVQFIQYWGDPIALSLITPEQFNWRRWIPYCVERYLHRKADRIVYGTESLYQAQRQLFKRERGKIFKCDVSYQPDNVMNRRTSDNANDSSNHMVTFGYFGNYFSNVRNIEPLYEAFRQNPGAKLIICGDGDIHFAETQNVKVHGRMPQSRISQMEKYQDVIVCLLNKVGVQVPGKIFYQTNSDRIILVILDGPYKQLIYEDLKHLDRFVFCNNTVKDISHAVNEICKQFKYQSFDVESISPENVCGQILG